ncbi:MAG: hypothetical protein IK028_01590 [Bacilli bacterium]|nr:hypothetical protein [Bacilli bacterium]
MRSLYIYIGITIFIGIFGAVYEVFSHNVFSPAMYLAWLIPCFLGVGVYLALAFAPIDKVPGTLVECIYNFGVAMFTVRSIFIGVIEIYGTTNKAMLATYTVLSIVFLVIGGSAFLAIILYSIISSKRKNNRQGV